MSDRAPGALVQDLLPLVRQFCRGPYGIALGGSCAKGIGDEHSDVDAYLFAETVLPADQRDALVEASLDGDPQVVSWGQHEPFVEGGTDFWHRGRKVEVWLRNSARVAETLADCRQGCIRRDYVRWTVMGFFNYVVLSDVYAMRIVDDPCGLLGDLKQQVAAYPKPLRDAILTRFLAEAQFWPDNFHYRTAVERADAIYTTGIVQLVVHALIQVLFALNGTYFPGEKKLADTLGALPVTPREAVARVRALLYPAQEPSVQALRAQRAELARLVAEVEQLLLADERRAAWWQGT
jgi:hypothetical protein